jgi:hypothetical protein
MSNETKGRLDNELCRASEFKVGIIYGGTPVGQFQKDKDGNYWWKRCDGSIMQVKPHPDAIFYVVEKCFYE